MDECNLEKTAGGRATWLMTHMGRVLLPVSRSIDLNSISFCFLFLFIYHVILCGLLPFQYCVYPFESLDLDN